MSKVHPKVEGQGDYLLKVLLIGLPNNSLSLPNVATSLGRRASERTILILNWTTTTKSSMKMIYKKNILITFVGMCVISNVNERRNNNKN